MVGLMSACSFAKTEKDCFAKVREYEIPEPYQLVMNAVQWYQYRLQVDNIITHYEKQDDGTYVVVSENTTTMYYFIRSGFFYHYEASLLSLRKTDDPLATYYEATIIFEINDDEYGVPWFTTFPTDPAYEISPALLVSLARRAPLSTCSDIFAGIPIVFLKNETLPQKEINKTINKFNLVTSPTQGTFSIEYSGSGVNLTDSSGTTTRITNYALAYENYALKSYILNSVIETKTETTLTKFCTDYNVDSVLYYIP